MKKGMVILREAVKRETGKFILSVKRITYTLDRFVGQFL